MAFVSAGWQLVVQLVDAGENTTTKTYHFDPLIVTTAALAATASANVLAKLIAVTAAKPSSYWISEKFEDDAFVLPTSADAEVETVASCTALVDNHGSKKANFGIPAPITSVVFLSTTGRLRNQVNVNNAAMIAYHGLFTPGADVTLSDGEHLSAAAGSFLGGVRTTKRSRQA